MVLVVDVVHDRALDHANRPGEVEVLGHCRMRQQHLRAPDVRLHEVCAVVLHEQRTAIRGDDRVDIDVDHDRVRVVPLGDLVGVFRSRYPGTAVHELVDAGRGEIADHSRQPAARGLGHQLGMRRDAEDIVHDLPVDLVVVPAIRNAS